MYVSLLVIYILEKEREKHRAVRRHKKYIYACSCFVWRHSGVILQQAVVRWFSIHRHPSGLFKTR